MLNQPLADGTIVFGEVSLSGEIKPVAGQKKRLDQAKKLGYKNFITSETVRNISQAIQIAFPRAAWE